MQKTGVCLEILDSLSSKNKFLDALASLKPVVSLSQSVSQ